MCRERVSAAPPEVRPCASRPVPSTAAPEPEGLREGRPVEAWPQDLFHRYDFFSLHAAAGAAVHFRWGSDGRDAGTLHFGQVAPGTWRSPARGTFAGMSWRPDRPLVDALPFLEAVEAELRGRGARRLEVVLPPLGHDLQRVSDQVDVFCRQGWSLALAEIDEIVPVDETLLEARMDRGNAKRLRKCRRDGLTGRLLPPDLLRRVHENLVASRAARGWRLSMDLRQMQDMQDLYPDRVVLAGVESGGELVASAFCLRLCPDVLYVFAWGHLPEYNSWSPVVAVADALHAHCRSIGVRQLDLGTCPPDQPGLVRFKRGLGARGSLKVTLAKELQ